MQPVPTAEELMTGLANEKSYETWDELMYDSHDVYQIECTREVMTRFAKLHVEAALRLAAEKVSDCSTPVDRHWDTIIDIYPPENIK